MAAAGVELLADVHDLAVLGLAEVLGRLPFFWKLLRTTRRELVRRRPDLVLPIDYPGFNFRLSRQARSLGIPVLYYIAPQVWAWHRSRADELARLAAELAVILPFEEPLFRNRGGRVTFVGHPLLEEEPPVRTAWAAEVGIDAERPVLALFPGSRRQEIHRHLAIFGEAAAEIQRRFPQVQPVFARAATLPSEAWAGLKYPTTTDSWALLHAARAAVVKSGTSTLQAALAGVPMVVAYRMNAATFAAARRLVRVDHVGLVNLVAEERVMPELLQDEVTAARIAEAIGPFLVEDSAERARALGALTRVRHRLEPPAGRRVAEHVVDLAASILRVE
jgi:lipid-A-disaccharide synthase